MGYFLHCRMDHYDGTIYVLCILRQLLDDFRYIMLYLYGLFYVLCVLRQLLIFYMVLRILKMFCYDSNGEIQKCSILGTLRISMTN